MNKNMKFSAISALLLSAGLLSAPAAIAASASASLGPITVRVVPLETGATFRWGRESNAGRADAFSTGPDASDEASYYNGDRDSFFSVLASAPSTNAFASTTPSLSEPSLFSSADALQTTISQDTHSGSWAHDQLEFTTSGVLAIYITANYSIFADAGDGLSLANAGAYLSLSFDNNDRIDHIDNQAMSISLDRVISSGSFDHNSGVVSDSGVLRSGIVTNGHGSGSFVREVSASAYQYAFPVPEPETYAMLLAGLGLLGFMAQRKVMA